jgi:hypothetical protein
MDLAKDTDRKLADLHAALQRTLSTVQRTTESAHHLVGDRCEYSYRGRERTATWRLDDQEALRRLAAGEGVQPYDANKAAETGAEYLAATARVDVLHCAIAELDAVFTRMPWSRFFIVEGGHIHSAQHCKGGTIRYNTRLGWLPDLSGDTERDAVEAHGAILCSHCFPTAPVEWTIGRKPTTKPGECTNKSYVPGSIVHHYLYGSATCSACGTVATRTSTGLLRKHKLPNLG